MGCLVVFILFLLAYIEISIFIAIAAHLGVMLTLMLLILTSCFGFAVLRPQGFRQLMSIQSKMFNQQDPNSEIIKNIALLLAGFLFVIPGFFTDFVALLLLLPPVQQLLAKRLLPYMQVKVYRHQTRASGRTFDGDYQRHDEPKKGKDDDPYSLH